MNQTKNLVIADINSHLHRAFHRALSKKSHELPNAFVNGKPVYMINDGVNIIENEIENLCKHIKEEIHYVALILDSKSKTFRHDLYPEYKANRPPSDPHFNSMVKDIVEILKLKGYFLLSVDGVEADDVINSICQKSSKVQNLNTYILTGDKDLFSLIRNNVKLFDGKFDKIFDINNCEERQGVPPHKVLDYLTFLGDKADNIIGVTGCGDTTAKAILDKYTFEDIMSNPDLILDPDLNIKRGRKNIIEYIKNNQDIIGLMRKLIIMKEDLDLGFTLKQLSINNINQYNPQIEEKFSSLGIIQRNRRL